MTDDWFKDVTFTVSPGAIARRRARLVRYLMLGMTGAALLILTLIGALAVVGQEFPI